LEEPEDLFPIPCSFLAVPLPPSLLFLPVPAGPQENQRKRRRKKREKVEIRAVQTPFPVQDESCLGRERSGAF
jgi:hypothetical protein